MTPAVARRLLYGIVVACLVVTGGTVLLRPAPPRVTAPQYPVVIPARLPFEVPGIGASPRFVTVPVDGGITQSEQIVVVPVHGLPGQVGASP
jgi:hypothetical protein